MSPDFARSQLLDASPSSGVARAYVRARGADRMSSFGDAVAVSTTVDLELAEILRREVSDLIVAPAYEPEALEVLQGKRGGRYLVLEMDPGFEPPAIESRELFGVTVEQERNGLAITPDLFRGGPDVPDPVVETLVVATTALKYTQSTRCAWRGTGR